MFCLQNYGNSQDFQNKIPKIFKAQTKRYGILLGIQVLIKTINHNKYMKKLLLSEAIGASVPVIFEIKSVALGHR